VFSSFVGRAARPEIASFFCKPTIPQESCGGASFARNALFFAQTVFGFVGFHKVLRFLFVHIAKHGIQT